MIVNPYESPQVEVSPPRDVQSLSVLPAECNRLGIKHGLLYLLGVVIAAALNSLVRETIRHQYFPPEWWPLLVTVALDGAGIAGCLWFGWQRLSRNPAFPRSFGHWLLLIQGASFVVDQLFLMVYDTLIPRLPGGETSEVSSTIEFQVRALYGVLRIVVAVVPWLALSYSRKETLWVRYGGIVFVAPLLTALWYFIGWERSELAVGIQTALGFLGLLCLIIAAVRDLNHSQQLDQLHWTGIVFQLALIFWYRFTESYWASLDQQ
jgi:hypothetical protein